MPLVKDLEFWKKLSLVLVNSNEKLNYDKIIEELNAFGIETNKKAMINVVYELRKQHKEGKLGSVQPESSAVKPANQLPGKRGANGKPKARKAKDVRDSAEDAVVEEDEPLKKRPKIVKDEEDE